MFILHVSGLFLSDQPTISIRVLSDLHWVLCVAVHKANTIFSSQLLAVMFSIFVHIIITPYFFFLDLVYSSSRGSTNNLGYLIIQIVWIITHVLHLVLLIWPCAATTDQVRKM